MPLPVYLTVYPVSNAWDTLKSFYFGQAQRKPGRPLSFDGKFWWLAGECFEASYFGKGPGWLLQLNCVKTGKKQRMRIRSNQLSQYDQWQISLLFELYRL